MSDTNQQPEAPEPEPAAPAEVAPEDYAKFQAWQADQAAAAKGNGTDPPERRQIVIELAGEDRYYTLADSAEEVRAYLGALVTFADTASERAAAIFEAALEPDDFERLQRDIRPVLRQVRRDHMADPENNLSVAETWQALADGVIDAIQEMLGDPKGGASPGGRSRTGGSSRPGSVKSALPSTT